MVITMDYHCSALKLVQGQALLDCGAFSLFAQARTRWVRQTRQADFRVLGETIRRSRWFLDLAEGSPSFPDDGERHFENRFGKVEVSLLKESGSFVVSRQIVRHAVDTGSESLNDYNGFLQALGGARAPLLMVHE